MSFLYLFSIFIFLFLCVFLCFVILIQESKSSGMGAIMGGSDTSSSVFGTSTADVLKKLTAWLCVAFLGSCLILSSWTAGMERSRTEAPPQIEVVD